MCFLKKEELSIPPQWLSSKDNSKTESIQHICSYQTNKYCSLYHQRYKNYDLKLYHRPKEPSMADKDQKKHASK